MSTSLSISGKIFLVLCRVFSVPLAVIHQFFLVTGVLDIPVAVTEAPGGISINLQKIWYARLLKKVVSLWVRSPFRHTAYRLVHFDFEIPAGRGLILATCHTPWKRLLVNWFYKNYYALIIDTGRSVKRRSRLRDSRRGNNEMARLVRYLKQGGTVIIAADNFDQSDKHPARMMGKSGNLSRLPARLSRIAGVPLLAAIPQLRKDGIHIYAGPQYTPPAMESESGSMMQSLLIYFETEIKKDPSIWSYFVNDPLSHYHKKIIR